MFSLPSFCPSKSDKSPEFPLFPAFRFQSRSPFLLTHLPPRSYMSQKTTFQSWGFDAPSEVARNRHANPFKRVFVAKPVPARDLAPHLAALLIPCGTIFTQGPCTHEGIYIFVVFFFRMTVSRVPDCGLGSFTGTPSDPPAELVGGRCWSVYPPPTSNVSRVGSGFDFEPAPIPTLSSSLLRLIIIIFYLHRIHINILILL